MEKFGKSQPVRRFEDQRFITGAGGYVDDVTPDGAAFAVFVRAQVAHASLAPLDLSDVREMPGVLAALAVEDLESMGMKIDMDYSVIANRDGTKSAAPLRPVLAKGRVRFVGEPMAIVVAETLNEARDAAEAVFPDMEDLAAKVSVTPGGPDLHDEAAENLAFDWAMGDADAVTRAFDSAAHVVETVIEDNRVMAVSMEPRGCFANWDGERLTVSYGGQGPWGTRDQMARMFGLENAQVRVTHPDVGGGFGMKGFDYPEYFAIAAAAKSLGRPVRWMSERTEAMLSDNGGRDLVSTTRLAFDADHRLLAYHVETLSNLGAYNSGYGQFIQTELFAKVLMGVYDCQATLLEVKGIFTNTAPVDAYRGAGRPEAIFALERSMDNAARQLGVDPLELREKNFIPTDAFPYTTATGELYDVGDFPKLLARVRSEADMAGFAVRKSDSAKRGKLRGIGLCYYIESILGDADERAAVEFHEDGTATLFVGTQSNGQGHETVFAQFLADQSGIPVEKIRIVQGDTDRVAKGGGTGGSRSVTVQTNVTLKAVATIVEAFGAFLAEREGVDTADVGFDDEQFRIAGSNVAPTMLEVAAMAREAGRDDLLHFRVKDTIPGRSYPNGAHVAEVEIDPDTGKTEVVKYTVTDDFGNLINPMLAEGQVHGGVAQGIGQAITERVVYSEDGQLVTATFMDYAMPRAYDMPMIDFTVEPVPSTMNPMGMKGCGEAGTVGALAAVSNAVADAMADRGVTDVQMPFTPERVWRALNGAAMAAE